MTEAEAREFFLSLKFTLVVRSAIASTAERKRLSVLIASIDTFAKYPDDAEVEAQLKRNIADYERFQAMLDCQ